MSKIQQGLIMTIAVLLCIGLSARAFAQEAVISPILIVEVQTSSSSSATQEFIELANVSDTPMDVSDWRVEYFSATASDFSAPSRTIPLRGILPPAAHYLLASTSYLVGNANDSFSAGLAATGGHLRLVSTDENNPKTPVVHDLVGWGNALFPEKQAATVSTAGQSLQRKVDSQSRYVDTDNNSSDFETGSPSPEGYVPGPDAPDLDQTSPADEPAEIDQTPPETSENPITPDGSSDSNMSAAKLDITELLPNPAAPKTDAADEFIELYNPNDELVDLTGYKLQTGITYSHSYEFNDQVLGPHTYRAFYVSETGVVLTNSAGKARLIDPSGQVMSETADYTDAGEGMSWSLVGSVWQWSSSITPGAPNQITDKAAQETAEKQAVVTKPTTKKASTAKPKNSVKAAAVKGVKASGNNGSGAGVTQTNAEATQTADIHPAVLAGVGSLALLYGLYEYRHDMANAIQRFRSHRTHRRATR